MHRRGISKANSRIGLILNIEETDSQIDAESQISKQRENPDNQLAVLTK